MYRNGSHRNLTLTSRKVVAPSATRIEFGENLNFEHLIGMILSHLRFNVDSGSLTVQDYGRLMKEVMDYCDQKDIINLAQFCDSYTKISLERKIVDPYLCIHCSSQLKADDEYESAIGCSQCGIVTIVPQCIHENSPYDPMKTFRLALDDLCGFSRKTIPDIKERLNLYLKEHYNTNCDEIRLIPLDDAGRRGRLTVSEMRNILFDIGCQSYYDVIHGIMYTYLGWEPLNVICRNHSIILRHYELIQSKINELNAKRRERINVKTQLRLYTQIRLITSLYTADDFHVSKDSIARRNQEQFLEEAIHLASEEDPTIVFAC